MIGAAILIGGMIGSWLLATQIIYPFVEVVAGPICGGAAAIFALFWCAIIYIPSGLALAVPDAGRR
ncbi:MAG TPA: hypothetical protein ENJ31_01555 [Anaerolineae bacterium]|nr:hypothetical protein [Anaerolineae bacterium]